MAAMWADPQVTRFIGGQPSSTQQSWARLLNYTGHWAQMGFGYWLVEELSTGEFVGEIGFAEFKRQIDPPILGTPEAGWVVSPQHQGKGYATEALQTILKWGDQHFQPAKTVCMIAPENTQSIRVAEKCGYQQLCVATYQGHPTFLFSRTST
jgi:RimJ/RimL family protein N-acetyltransferase